MLLACWCVDNKMIGYFAAGQVVTVYHAAEGLFARSIDVAESGGALKHCVFTDASDEGEKPAREKALPRSGLAQIGASHESRSTVIH